MAVIISLNTLEIKRNGAMTPHGCPKQVHQKQQRRGLSYHIPTYVKSYLIKSSLIGAELNWR